MPRPLRNSVFLQVENALIEEITTESGFKLFLAPEYNLEHNVTVCAKVAELPTKLKANLSVGDEVAFSYTVISDRAFPDTVQYFVPVAEGSHIKIWMNGKGEKVRMLAKPGVISLIWTGTYFDSKGQFQHGAQGTEREIDRWLHKNFSFGKPENFIYKNKITLNDKDYWKCSLENIFAKKVGDEIVSVSDRVICTPIDIPVDEQIREISGIHLPEGNIEMRLYDRATVVSGGESLGLKKGDIVSFEQKYCEKYELWGKMYFLIRERRLDGTWLAA